MSYINKMRIDPKKLLEESKKAKLPKTQKVSVYLQQDTWDEFRAICKDRGSRHHEVIERMLKRFVKECRVPAKGRRTLKDSAEGMLEADE